MLATGIPQDAQAGVQAQGSVSLERHGSVLLVTLEAPQRANALDDSDLRQLMQVWDAVDGDDTVRAVVLTGSGRTFCAGYDLASLRAGAPGSLIDNPFPAAAQRLTRLDTPVIAAINGPVAGAAVHMVLACDIRIAAPRATFALPAASLGIIYDPDAIGWMARELGLGLTRRLLLGAERLKAADLLAAGVLAEIVDTADLKDRALDLAGRIARLAPLSLAGMKRVLGNSGGCKPLSEQFRGMQVEAAMSEDAREALMAVAEGRAPLFGARR